MSFSEKSSYQDKWWLLSIFFLDQQENQILSLISQTEFHPGNKKKTHEQKILKISIIIVILMYWYKNICQKHQPVEMSLESEPR